MVLASAAAQRCQPLDGLHCMHNARSDALPSATWWTVQAKTLLG
jgi:hypothetical protein